MPVTISLGASFGDYKQSGIGREESADELRTYTQVRTLKNLTSGSFVAVSASGEVYFYGQSFSKGLNITVFIRGIPWIRLRENPPGKLRFAQVYLS